MYKDILLLLGEEIKSIVGYEGLYSVTSRGRIYSHEKIRRCGKGFRTVKAKFLKPSLDNGGKGDYVKFDDIQVFLKEFRSIIFNQLYTLYLSDLRCKKELLEKLDDVIGE